MVAQWLGCCQKVVSLDYQTATAELLSKAVNTYSKKNWIRASVYIYTGLNVKKGLNVYANHKN